MTKTIAKPARLPGWEIALVETLARHQQMPFAYGTGDCLIRIADVALAMTGSDPMADIRGTYDDAKGADAALKKLGFASIEVALADRFVEIAPADARRGDCGVADALEADDGPAAVVVVGDMVMGARAPHSAAARKKPCHVWASRDRLVKAYRIG